MHSTVGMFWSALSDQVPAVIPAKDRTGACGASRAGIAMHAHDHPANAANFMCEATRPQSETKILYKHELASPSRR